MLKLEDDGELVKPIIFDVDAVCFSLIEYSEFCLLLVYLAISFKQKHN